MASLMRQKLRGLRLGSKAPVNLSSLPLRQDTRTQHVNSSISLEEGPGASYLWQECRTPS